MSQLTTQSLLHSRLICFIDWIKPDPDKKERNAEQAANVRKYVTTNAEEDGITVKSTPAGGSDEKDTGLRRHYRGNSEVDGYDIDIPFVLKSEDADGKELQELLTKFEGYVKKSYPDSTISITNSSVNLLLSNDLSFDVVPMVATDKVDEQIIIKKDGNRIRTSVQKHNNFIKSRTRKSKEMSGRVTFNECVRAMKWWREFQAADSYYLGYDETTGKDNRPPSALIDWLAAFAFDTLGVERTYAETLARWFGFLANVVRKRMPVISTDYYSYPTLAGQTGWVVLDPVNADNNITKSWNDSKINELATWLERGRDSWNRIIRYDIDGDDNLAMEELVKLFGNPFKHHCEKDK